MSLKLRKRGAIWSARGTVDGIHFPERSTRCSDKRLAERIRAKWESELLERSIDGLAARITFEEAVSLYLAIGGEDRFVWKLKKHFAGWRCTDIDQRVVNSAARVLYPGAAKATLNRQVITPMSAILKAAGFATPFRRYKTPPKPPRACPNINWFNKVLPHCSPGLAAIIIFQATTGARVSEAVRLKHEHLDLRAGRAELTRTKTKPRSVTLSPNLVAAIANLDDGDPVFGFRDRFALYRALKIACKKAVARYYSSHEFGRHYLARALLRNGYSLKFVQEAGGWASITIVADTYGYLEQDYVAGAIDEIAGEIGHQLGR